MAAVSDVFKKNTSYAVMALAFLANVALFLNNLNYSDLMLGSVLFASNALMTVLLGVTILIPERFVAVENSLRNLATLLLFSFIGVIGAFVLLVSVVDWGTDSGSNNGMYAFFLCMTILAAYIYGNLVGKYS